MKAKIVFIQVKESRLAKWRGDIKINSDPFTLSHSFQPIKPVLVDDSEIKVGDSFVFEGKDVIECICTFSNPKGVSIVGDNDLSHHKEFSSKIITQDTEELYEQIASGELIEDVWYEFENWDTQEVRSPKISEQEIEEGLARPLKVVGEGLTLDIKAMDSEERELYDMLSSKFNPIEMDKLARLIVKDTKKYIKEQSPIEGGYKRELLESFVEYAKDRSVSDLNITNDTIEYFLESTASQIKPDRVIEEEVKQAVDFKYMQIPNICFSLTKPDDDREIGFKKQRLERGFDDSETWSLRDTVANFIIPRLERYEEIAKDFLKREPELEEDIECFLISMKLMSRDNGSLLLTKEEEKQLQRGLEVFPKIFMSLWW